MNDVEFVKIFKFSLNFGTKKDFVLSNINSNVVSDSIGLILNDHRELEIKKKKKNWDISTGTSNTSASIYSQELAAYK